MSLRLPDAAYKALCKVVLQRDGFKCRSCGVRSALHVHHIVFRSQGGEDTYENLLTVCNSCHDGVHKDVKDGEYGLVIWLDLSGAVQMKRRTGWRPS